MPIEIEDWHAPELAQMAMLYWIQLQQCNSMLDVSQLTPQRIGEPAGGSNIQRQCADCEIRKALEN
jgi:hypothetical protein